MAKCLPEFISSLVQVFTKVMVNDYKPEDRKWEYKAADSLCSIAVQQEASGEAVTGFLKAQEKILSVPVEQGNPRAHLFSLRKWAGASGFVVIGPEKADFRSRAEDRDKLYSYMLNCRMLVSFSLTYQNPGSQFLIPAP